MDKAYLLADKYEVPGMELYVRGLVKNEVKQYQARHDVVVWMLDDVFGKTINTKSHIALREPLLRLAVSMRNDESMWENLQPVMRSHPEFSVGLANYFHRMLGRKRIACCLEENEETQDPDLDATDIRCYSCGECGASKRNAAYANDSISDRCGDSESRQLRDEEFSEDWEAEELKCAKAAAGP
ncbi:uncharacterized protein PgNI_08123 [Pyricularia grisea]|uniref:Uncharacterized protein n=1 Tax=Pyricularia grisea TaxID=148305 RepID=A0A6P8AVW1_PYRGI|nr:uncharacterized protein PgNI_08123 [Pyricularia grisea]TLD06366.1 hypothetical protein PgNI_08123 [Pyricularia grisea]